VGPDQDAAPVPRPDDTANAVELIDAQFPPYEQVIPKEHKKVITVDRMRMIDAQRRAQLMSSETRGVKIAAIKTQFGARRLSVARNHVRVIV
jgi:DNA polymerase III sliding clamp (beta) subunit (PCNA family)